MADDCHPPKLIGGFLWEITDAQIPSPKGDEQPNWDAQPQQELPSCIGGHLMVPKEQKTQQSPLLGFSSELHDSHS